MAEVDKATETHAGLRSHARMDLPRSKKSRRSHTEEQQCVDRPQRGTYPIAADEGTDDLGGEALTV